MQTEKAGTEGAAGGVSGRGQGLVRIGVLLLSARGLFLFIATILLMLFLIRSLAFSGTGGDDSEQIVFAQYLAIGYFPRNPPLYAWLVYAMQHVFGVSVMAVAAVKFLSIGGTCAVLFAAGRRLYRDERLAALAALAPLATYLLFWNGVKGLSNSILVMLPCALTFYALLRLYAEPRARWYLAFGVFAALGFLSKYGYGIFLLSLLAAMACDRTARARLLRPESLLAAAAACLILAPYILWFVDKRSATMAAEARVGVLPGLWHLASSAFGASAPLWILLPVFFPQIFRRTGRGGAAAMPGDDAPALRRLLGIHLIAALVLLAVMGAVSGLRVRPYYMSILILFPLYVFARLQATGWRPKAAALFALAAAAMPAGATATFAGRALLDGLWCRKCEWHLPCDAWSAQLRAAGFTQGTIVADWWPYPLAGNVKIRFPASRVATVKHPFAIAPETAAPGSCLLLWGTPERREAVVGFANDRLAAGIDPKTEGKSLAAPFRFVVGGDREHRTTLHYLLLKDGAGRCR